MAKKTKRLPSTYRFDWVDPKCKTSLKLVNKRNGKQLGCSISWQTYASAIEANYSKSLSFWDLNFKKKLIKFTKEEWELFRLTETLDNDE